MNAAILEMRRRDCPASGDLRGCEGKGDDRAVDGEEPFPASSESRECSSRRHGDAESDGKKQPISEEGPPRLVVRKRNARTESERDDEPQQQERRRHRAPYRSESCFGFSAGEPAY